MIAGYPGFENDVKEYGIQTYIRTVHMWSMFENDVKEYGIQTKDDILYQISDV